MSNKIVKPGPVVIPDHTGTRPKLLIDHDVFEESFREIFNSRLKTKKGGESNDGKEKHISAC